MTDEGTGRVAFVEESAGEMPEPLHMPRGSIRAMTALATSGSCWALMATGRDVPGAVLSLLLTVLGYYFGFRVKVKAAGSRIYDPSAVEAQPLGLPGGVVRKLLILGFAVTGVVLLVRGRLGEPAYVEFFIVLAGLVAGYVFGRIFSTSTLGPAAVLLNHVKGAAVLAAAGLLAVLLVSGAHADLPPAVLIVLCALISFYYGSRS